MGDRLYVATVVLSKTTAAVTEVQSYGYVGLHPGRDAAIGVAVSQAMALFKGYAVQAVGAEIVQQSTAWTPEQVEAAIAKAVAAERERCAMLCEVVVEAGAEWPESDAAWLHGRASAARSCARRIREPGEDSARG